MNFRIATRRSPLAMWQTRLIMHLIETANPGVTCEVLEMDTTGDKIRDKPLPSIGGKGLFTRELEDALLDESVDFAVHSLKDLPTGLPEGLAYVCSPERAEPTDAFISSKWSCIEDVPADGVIATGSLRRKAQLLSQKPGLQFRELRGNIDTRLRKLEENGWDGIIMATAALHRLERQDLVAFELPPEVFVPAVSQGAIGIEAREDDARVHGILKTIAHADTMTAVSAERVFMKALEGGCSVPLGAYCRRVDTGWRFTGWVGSVDGTSVLRDEITSPDPKEAAENMADSFIERGARDILRG